MTELPRDRRLPHPGRLDPARPDYARIVAAHEAAMRAGSPAYADPATGLQVFTALFLWDRGFCCDTGCRHCPYIARPETASPTAPTR